MLIFKKKSKKSKRNFENTENIIEYWKKIDENRKKEIARLERQIAVTEGDTSDENKKNLRELRSKLKSLKDEQEDTFYDKSIEDQENALDEMLKNSQDQEEQQRTGFCRKPRARNTCQQLKRPAPFGRQQR